MINVRTKITSEKFDVMIKTGINFEPKGWTVRGCPELDAWGALDG
jgi:hypothetical protein